MKKISRSLEGVILTPLKNIDVDGGNVLHAMKKTDSGYKGFGEAYFSTIDSYAIKAWKLHKQMTLNLVVPIGKIKFVIYDNRDNSLTSGNYQEIILSKENYSRLTIPPALWMGFQGLSKTSSLLLNIADIEHSKEDILRLNQDEINYDWRNIL